jgi:type IV secretory pathway VirB4 component
MFRTEQITKEYKQACALHAHLNLFGFWDDEAFITKSGDVGLVLKLAGVDYESLDHAGRDHVAKRLEAALRTFDGRTRIYQILFKRNRPEIPSSNHPNPIVQGAIEQRTAFLQSRAERLYELDIYFVLVREGSFEQRSAISAIKRMPKDFLGAGRDLLSSLSSEKSRVLLRDQIDSIRRELEQAAHSFAAQLSDVTEIQTLDADGAFCVLFRLLNLDHDKTSNAALLHPQALDYQL